ncbi:MAG: tetratricopeptide repeat protein [Bryobacteraceae bacterium]
MDTLRRHPRMPISELLGGTRASNFRDSRETAASFYAETWALADILISSPEYGRLDRFFAAMRAGKSGQQAFEDVYRKSLLQVGRDLQSWILGHNSPQHFVPAANPASSAVAPTRVSDLNAGMLLADLLVANGEWSRAEAKYRELLREHPDEPKLLTSVGVMAFRGGSKAVALENWRKAIDSGANDPGLCYRFALLAEEAGLPEDEIAHALEKTISAKPDFADARYRLAIIESNRGNYAAAVAQLKAMGAPSGPRAYSYWSALASSLSELGRTEEATAAAQQAKLSAATPEQRGIASALEYTTKTDFHVQFERDANGEMKAVSIRTPHGFQWNPFIEARDVIERTDGQLRTVQCREGRLVGFSVDTASGPLQLDVPDPTHVLMRNSPSEFSCGAQQPRTVKLEYAKSTASRGPLLRGMEFQ